jgi:hypothetical protein
MTKMTVRISNKEDNSEDEYVQEGYGSEDGDGFSDYESNGSGSYYEDNHDDFYERTDAYYSMENVVDENGIEQAMI